MRLQNIMNSIFELIKKHEGYRQFPYVDTVGKITIGHGFNLTDVGLDKEECRMILDYRIGQCMAKLRTGFLWFDALDSVRQDVLIDMTYQLGFQGLLKFVMTLKHIELKEYDLAAETILDSKAARQCPNRYKELAQMMRTGKYNDIYSG